MTQLGQTLAGKVALVTDGARGIGGGIAIRLAADGAFVIVQHHREHAAADALVAAIRTSGGGAVAIEADVGSVEAIRQFYRDIDHYLATERGSGKIDFLINNADAIEEHGLDADDGVYTRMLGINLKAPFFIAIEGLERLSDGGRIVNISSSAARSANPAVPLYSIAKHGMTGLTRNLALFLGARNIRVNGVEPGMTVADGSGASLGMGAHLTALVKQSIALGRMGEPADVAAVVAFLVSDAGGWVTGQSIPVDGGFKL